MQKRVLLIVVVIAAFAAGLWFWKGRQHGESTAPPTTMATGSARGATASVPAAPRASAQLDVTVHDAKGPIDAALVRLAGPDGDVVTAKTKPDGSAHVDGLGVGEWTVSASAADHVPRAAKVKLLAGETAKLDLALDAGGRALSGIVTDTSGGPIAGARVDVAKLGGLARASDAVAMTTTGADGKYKLTVDGDQVLVGVNHPDYAPQSRYVDVPPTGGTADFKLVPGGVIEGVVRDEKSKEPVVGARVEAARDQGAMIFGEVARRHATAGPDGRFRITGLRPGAYELTASAASRFSRAPTIVGLGVAEQVTDVVILVSAGGAIRGVVRDETGAPAAGVEVEAFGAERAVTADERSTMNGTFELDGLAPGHYSLRGSSDVFVAAGRTDVELGMKDVEGVIVTVKHGTRAVGHVEPRQICDVRLERDDAAVGPDMLTMGRVAPVTTGEDGEFSIGPVSDGAFELSARCASGDQGKLATKLPAQALVLPVTSGASLAGRVTDAAGKPVAGVTVSATAHTSRGESTTIVNGMVTSGAQTLTAPNGTFEIRGLSAGTYRLGALDRGRPLPVKKGDGKLELAASQHRTGLELVVDRPDGTIKGTVTGPDGQPVADAWVSATQGIEDLAATMEHGEESQRMIMVDDSGGSDASTVAPVLTDASGHFEIGGLVRGPWTVVAGAQAGKLRGRAAHVTPDATITIQMQQIGELRGTVHASGTPPASFTVALEGPLVGNGPSPPGAYQERTFVWTDGSFAFSRVDAGTYKVHVTSSAGNGEATITMAAPTTSVDITLAANAVVIGKLVDTDGKPLAGVGMTTVPDDGSPGLRISLEGPPPLTGPDGAFRIETKAGKVIVVALTQPRPTTKRGVVLQAGATVDAGTLTAGGPPPPAPGK